MDNTGGALSFDALIRDTNFKKQLDYMEQRLRTFSQVAQEEGRRTDDTFRKLGTGLAAFFTFQQGAKLVNQIIQVRGEFQKLEISLRVMLKSKEKADALMSQMVKLAASTPFTLDEVAQGGKQLLAYGENADTVIDTLRRLGDIAAGVAAPLNDLVYLYGTTRTQGQMYARDILQFAGRGIPIYDELAKVTGQSTAAIKTLASEGKIGFEELEQVVKNLTDQGGLFYNLMEEQSSSLTGRISNLKDKFSEMLNDIGQSNEGILYGGIELTTAAIENYKEIGKILLELVAIYGSYKTAVIAAHAFDAAAGLIRTTQAAMQVVRAVQILTAATKAQTIAQMALNAVSPLGWMTVAVTLIGGLVAGYALWGDKQSELSKTEEERAKAHEDAADALEKEIEHLKTLASNAQNLNSLERTRKKALDELKAATDGYLSSLTLENINTKEKKELIEGVIKTMKAQGNVSLLGNDLEANKADVKEVQANIEKLYKTLAERQKEMTALGAETVSNAQAMQVTQLQIDHIHQLITDKIKEQNRLKEQQISLVYQLKEAEQTYKDIVLANNKNAAEARTVKLIEEEISGLKEKQKAQSKDKSDFTYWQKKIDILEKEKDAITGGADANKKAAEAAKEAVQEELNAYEELIAQKKRLYTQYDRWVAGYGVASAKGQFTELVKSNTTYTEWLASEIAKIQSVAKKSEIDAEKLKGLQEALTNETDKAEEDQLTAYKKRLDEKLSYQRTTQDKINTLLSEQTKLQKEPKTISNADKLTELDKQLNELRGKYHQEEIDRLRELVIEYQTLEDKKKAIIEKGVKDAIDLRYEGNEKEAQNAIDKANEAVKEIDKTLFENQSTFQDITADLTTWTQDQLNAYLDLLNGAVQGSNSAVKEAVQKEISDVKELINLSISSLTQKVRSTRDELKKAKESGNQLDIIKTAKAYNQAKAEYNKALTKSFDTAAQTLGSLSQSVGQVDEQLGRALNTAGQFMNAFASITAGDPLSGFLGIANGIFSIFSQLTDNTEKEQRKVEKQQEAVDTFITGVQQLTKVLDELERSMNKAFGADRVELFNQGINIARDGIVNTTKRLNELMKRHDEILVGISRVTGGGRIENAGTLFNLQLPELSKDSTLAQIDAQATATRKNVLELYTLLNDPNMKWVGAEAAAVKKELEATLSAYEQYYADLDAFRQQKIEYLTGTNEDAVAQSLVNGFAEGKDSAKDFADNFKQLMRDAMLQSLKASFLDPKIKTWMAQFADAMESGGGLTAEEVGLLRQSFNGIVTGSKAYIDAMEAVAGMPITDLMNLANETLSGAVKGITEDQASILAGTFNAIRFQQTEMITILNQDTQHLEEIAMNTRLLKNILDALKTTGSGNALGGSGISL